MEKNKSAKWWAIAIVATVVSALGYIIFLAPESGGGQWADAHADGGGQWADAHADGGTGDHEHSAATPSNTVYACPMHMQIRSDSPGKCPLCGMNLEPFHDTGEHLQLDARQRADIGLAVESVQRRILASEIRTVGIFEPDETRQKIVSAWVDGRIERLYADFTGVDVERGTHLFDLYSPTLYATQNEFVLARRALEAMTESHPSRKAQEMVVAAARDKLRLLGFDEHAVAALEASGKPELVVTVPSPIGGVVIEKHASQGMYVERGQPVYRVADLSHLWLMAEIHERDLPLIALGQTVEIHVDALPGGPRAGKVGFIDAVLSPATRTSRVRIEVDNTDRKLRPGMFATVMVISELGTDGSPSALPVEGAYACAMHPLERSEKADAHCAICGMEMVRAQASGGRVGGPVLAVPRSAVLSTGVRKLVYVETRENPDGAPEYMGVELTLGPLASEWHVTPEGVRHKLGEYYPILAGLEEGTRIVVDGQFLVDSQMELTGKPSLLHPTGLGTPGGVPKASDPHAGHAGH